MRDLYREAVVEGQKMHKFQTGGPTSTQGVLRATTPLVLGPEGEGYWIARHAARQASDALLEKAKALGVPDDQWEELRKVAAEVAYD